MDLNVRKVRLILAAAVLTTVAGCFGGVPLNSSRGYRGVRVANAVKKDYNDRTVYRAQSLSPTFVTVNKGDTVYSLSRKYSVPIRDLIETNRLKAPFSLSKGQRLRLPPASVHIVRKGDTVYSLSRRYAVDMSLLSRMNGIRAPYYDIYPGQLLKLPGSIVEIDDSKIVAQKAAPKSSVRSRGYAAQKATTSKSKTASKNSIRLPPPPVRSSGKFLWPVNGSVMTTFGDAGAGRHNDGINIRAAEGTTVLAAENGVIAYAGNELKGFGNLLLVKHSDGWMTAYAHNKNFLVKRGDTVKRGQPIAKVGKSGNAKEPQLHFEIRKGTKAVDPQLHLAQK